jgi:hypothetical protein
MAVVYGSWSMADNPDPKAITIGNSHVRYWLPLFTASSVLVALAFLRIREKMTHGLRSVVGSTALIVVIGAMSIHTVFSGSDGTTPVSITTYGTGEFNYFVSLDAAGYIMSSGDIVYSDARIKKNIVDVDDDMALNYIRQIEPKTYQYIDYKKKGTSNVFGFIAQQIANVLPYATSLINDFIPDVYSFANCISSGNNTTKLVFTSNIYTYDLCANNYIKLIGPRNNLIYANITVIENANIYIDTLIPHPNIFVYGKLVNDFVSLNKDAIFTVGISAIQDLDKITSNTNVSVTSLQSTVQTMQAQIDALTARVVALENK